MALAMLSVSALAESDGEGVLASGIFETDESSIKFPAAQDTNIDSLEVGNDRALAIARGVDPVATNNLEIEKNQDSGACTNGKGPGGCCMNQLASTEATRFGNDTVWTSDCADCCIKVNVDQIKVGNRDALAFGFAAAENNVKICADQK